MKFTSELLTALSTVLALVIPGMKNFFRSKKQKAFIEKELLENALKHLYDCDSRGSVASCESMAGVLGISRKTAAELEEQMEAGGLITYENDRLKLTAEGRGYALKVIRIHRLWESYLADKTGLPENDCHTDAEEREHLISEAEADALASRRGNPVYDPHGDPIPDKDGNMPPVKGALLREAAPDTVVRVTHIEDEPSEVYEQITAEKLYPGMMVRVLDNREGKIHFVADGEERVFTRLLSSNVSVIPVEDADVEPAVVTTLDKIGKGYKCEIHMISKRIRGQQRRRLMDLGFVPGSRVAFEMASASGDPVAFRVRGAVAALRLEQAKQIFVKNVEKVA